MEDTGVRRVRRRRENLRDRRCSLSSCCRRAFRAMPRARGCVTARAVDPMPPSRRRESHGEKSLLRL